MPHDGNAIQPEMIEEPFDIIQMPIYVKKLLIRAIRHGIAESPLIEEHAAVLVGEDLAQRAVENAVVTPV
jgi:hypothetical protein